MVINDLRVWLFLDFDPLVFCLFNNGAIQELPFRDAPTGLLEILALYFHDGIIGIQCKVGCEPNPPVLQPTFCVVVFFSFSMHCFKYVIVLIHSGVAT